MVDDSRDVDLIIPTVPEMELTATKTAATTSEVDVHTRLSGTSALACRSRHIRGTGVTAAESAKPAFATSV